MTQGSDRFYLDDGIFDLDIQLERLRLSAKNQKRFEKNCIDFYQSVDNQPRPLPKNSFAQLSSRQSDPCSLDDLLLNEVSASVQSAGNPNHHSSIFFPEGILAFRTNKKLLSAPGNEFKDSIIDTQTQSRLRVAKSQSPKVRRFSIASTAASTTTSAKTQSSIESVSEKFSISSKDSRISTKSSRITAWSESFDTLLKDTIGIKIFAKFCNKEFCEENVLFWQDCEKFKTIIKKSEVKKEARIIFDRYLSVNAPEAINIDYKTRSAVFRNLSNPTQDIFNNAQAQIYCLMRNDVYKRFLASDIYKKCLKCERTGESLLYCAINDSDARPNQTKRARRLSLPSWPMKKSSTNS